jgi:multiple antibiotic resistance protein
MDGVLSAGLAQDLITLFVVCDPLGSLPVFMAVGEELSAPRQRRLAALVALTAFGVLAGFALFGRGLLDLLDISPESFRIAGGLILFLFALTLVFGEPKHERDLASRRDLGQAAVFPLAIPSIASPGAMLTATLLAEGDGVSAAGAVVAMLAAVLLATFAILLAARPIHRIIGDAGAAVISRIMGMILAAVAVDEVLRALVHIGVIGAF